MKQRFLMSVLMAMAFCGIVSPATHYVDATNGLDSNSGHDVNAPWKTITKVEGHTFAPGDSCMFKRGEVWLHDRLTINEIGTFAEPVIFGAYGSGPAPIIDADNYYSYAIDVVGASYVQIQDVNLTGAKNTGAGMFIGSGSHIIISNVTSSANYGRGFQFWGSPITDVIVTDCMASDNGKSGMVLESKGTIDGISYYGCISIGNGSDGFSATAYAGTAANILWDHCQATDHLNTADGAGDGFTAHGSPNVTMRYCYSAGNAKAAICFINTTQATVYSNLLVAKAGAVIGGVHADGLTTLYGNTIYCPSQTGAGIKCTSGSIISRNNIVQGFSTGVWQAVGTTIDTDYDCVYGAATPYLYALPSSHSQDTNPILNPDFTLQATSPCIGKGMNLGEPYDEDYARQTRSQFWEIGAFEYLPISENCANCHAQCGRLN